LDTSIRTAVVGKKCMLRDKTMLNSTKIKSIASAVIELHLSEGINYSVRESVENSTNFFVIL